MWKIDKDLKISMTRGDTPVFKLNLTTKDEEGQTVPYVPKVDDEIIFALKKDAKSMELWASATIPTDTMELKFTEDMTRGLEFGNYVYEISLNNVADGYHDTFIANTPFTITEELYE